MATDFRKNTLLIFQVARAHTHTHMHARAHTHWTPVSFVFARILVKFQREANGAGEGRRKNMLEFSSPLRSSGFLNSNYTEVLPDASQHCQTKKTTYLHKVSLSFGGLGKTFISSLSPFFFSFHDVSSAQLEISRRYFQLIFQGRWGSAGPRSDAKTQGAGRKNTEITSQTQTCTDSRTPCTILNSQGH